MKLLRLRFVILIGLVALLALASSVSAEQSAVFTCPDGTVIENAVEVSFDFVDGVYVITVLGIDGFNPVLGLELDSGEKACNDDSQEALVYTLDLPTTGKVNSSPLNSQIILEIADGIPGYALAYIGGYGGSSGDFVVIVEGHFVTEEAPIFSIWMTQNMLNSGVSPAIYHYAADNVLDPLLVLGTEIDEPIIIDGEAISCDDAGTELCWGETPSLVGASVTVERGTVPGGTLDSLIIIPIEEIQGDAGLFLNFRFGSYNMASQGEFFAIFHLGVQEVAPTSDSK
ncbi:MAG: hypothetical protein SNJ59_06715 [Aggregatilineales bacterium]